MGPIGSLAVSAIRIGAGVYVLLCLWLFVRQASYIYYPQREVAFTPADAGLEFEALRLETEDGERLAAWFVPAAAPRGSVLFCHGNAGNLGDRLDSIRTFHDLRLDVLIFDYRGYGESSGRPTEPGTYRDGAAAWRHLIETRGADPASVVIFGRSLGGAVAARLAAGRRPAGLIVESTFTSVPDMAARLYPFLPARWLCRFRYNAREAIAAVRCPVLVAHSPQDEMVPYDHGRRLYEAARPPKRFVALAGGHNSGYADSSAEYRAALDEFLGEALP